MQVFPFFYYLAIRLFSEIVLLFFFFTRFLGLIGSPIIFTNNSKNNDKKY